MHILRRSLNLVRNGKNYHSKRRDWFTDERTVKMLRAKESNHKENNEKQIKEFYESKN